MANLHGREKAKHVVSLFRRIAHNYDLLNTLMSGGRHREWRKQAIQMFDLSKNGFAIDVATGTGDFSIEISRLSNVEKVFGVDFAKEMVVLAQQKSLDLMTNNPRKITALKNAGLIVNKRIPIKTAATKYNRNYLNTKAKKLGHLL